VSGDAQILDRGYRRYDGERSGVSGAVRSVAWHTTRSILGLGRKGRHKVFPVIVALVAMVPAVVFISIGVLFGEISEDFRPEYWEFFAFSITAGVLFTAFVAPEAIVRDQRDGMFALYLSTPLTKPTYLLAKSIAVVGTLWLIVGGPAMIAFLGYTSQGLGPDGFFNWLGVAVRLVLGGLIVSAIYAAISLAASSLTDRRAFASVAVILLMFGSAIATGAIVDGAGADDRFRLLNPLDGPLEVAVRMFGDRSEEFVDVSTPLVVAAGVAWFVLPSIVVALRYRKLSAV
jgi:ABC-2 type transport system permease protein